MGYWRLEETLDDIAIRNMTNAQLSDIVMDVDLATKDKHISKDKALNLLLIVSKELIRR